LQFSKKSLVVSEVCFNHYKPQITQIRNTIFVQEQNVPKDLEWDELDNTATHFIIESDQNNLIAYARLLPSGKLGRVAVIKQYRRQGIGNLLMTAIIEKAAKLGIETLRISAQVAVINFYTQLGFHLTSDIYLEAGIEHRTMLKTLK